MFTHIMVPLDGSEVAEGALPYAQHLARGSDATLHLVRVIEPRSAVRVHGVGAAVNVLQDEIGESQREADDYLRAMRDRLEGDGVRVETSHLDGLASTVLLQYAGEHEIDLIVMTAHGRSGLRRLALGSNADRITSSGVAPVLLIPPVIALSVDV